MELQEDSGGVIHHISTTCQICRYHASEVHLVLRYGRGSLTARLNDFEHYFYILFLSTCDNQKVSAKQELCRSIRSWLDIRKYIYAKEPKKMFTVAEQGVKLFEEYQALLFDIGLLTWTS